MKLATATYTGGLPENMEQYRERILFLFRDGDDYCVKYAPGWKSHDGDFHIEVCESMDECFDMVRKAVPCDCWHCARQM